MRIRGAVRAVVRRAVPVVQRSAVPAGLLVAAMLVWQTSHAAFTAQTTNGPNSFAAGQVSLSDNDGNTGTGMFTLTGLNALKPGDSVERCIRVTYGTASAANLPMSVKMYGSGYSSPTSPGNGGVLGTSLNLTIDVSADQSGWTSYPTCPTISSPTTVFNSTVPSGQTTNAGKLAGFATATDWSNGIPGQFSTATTSTSTVSRIYRVTAALPSDAPDSMQGSTAEITLKWEAQNT